MTAAGAPYPCPPRKMSPMAAASPLPSLKSDGMCSAAFNSSDALLESCCLSVM
eukprot:CAMPEP_0194093944 /NCGR_PEP_ID=MMETSP0149-20130528/52220_1 /TAXON_ID=122233 /ORGANISM="Chaetoceros debilis, Strain MM31A-1" /LENGTH=52 /DNA_ID=CAMNT_0038779425 /DNA_START=731 /DNA_END=889 /DNA_ORIENTATION=+